MSLFGPKPAETLFLWSKTDLDINSLVYCRVAKGYFFTRNSSGTYFLADQLLKYNSSLPVLLSFFTENRRDAT